MNNKPTQAQKTEPSPFRDQYLLCEKEGQVGINEGPEEQMIPAFPNKAYIEKVQKTGAIPVFCRSTCKRFGGLCSSGHPKCLELRNLKGADVMKLVDETRYTKAADGRTLSREKEYNTNWVLRDAEGLVIDHDRYRNDLAERHNLNLEM